MAEVRAGFPVFEVRGRSALSSLSQDGVLVACPRCGEEHVVRLGPWLAGEHVSGSTQTRACPICFRAARIPETSEEVVVERERQKREVMEEPESDERGFAEDPEDAEHVEVSEEDEEGDGAPEDV